MATLAHTVEINYGNGSRFGVWVDGVKLPWHLAEEGPDVEPGNRSQLTVVNLPIVVWGTVTIHRDGRTHTYDQELGDVRAFARELVRKGFADAYPDLDLPPQAAA